MEKLYILVGEKLTGNSVTIIASWSRMPSQDIISTLTSKLNHQYSRFAIMEDILFIEGGEEDKKNYFDY